MIETIALLLIQAACSAAIGVFMVRGDWNTAWKLGVLSALFLIASKLERLTQAGRS